MRWGARTYRADRRQRARKSPRILACQASVDQTCNVRGPSRRETKKPGLKPGSNKHAY